MHLTLLARAYCSLCETMQALVTPVAARFGATVEVIDIDAHPAWVERWGDLVPVLLLGEPEDGRELCHYHADLPALAQALAAAQRPPGGMAGEAEIR
ncbi:MAG: glutaredoxin family protein [Casimicrobiaceae bacterium]